MLYIIMICFLGIVISPKFYKLPSMGLFPTVMLMITLRSLANPEQERQFMCFPLLVKQKYYHWILLALFALMSGFMVFDLFCAVLIGHIEVKYFNGQMLKLSAEKIKKIENFIFSKVKNRADFV